MEKKQPNKNTKEPWTVEAGGGGRENKVLQEEKLQILYDRWRNMTKIMAENWFN